MHSSYMEPKGCHFLFHGMIRKKLIVVSLMVGFVYVSVSSFVCLHSIVRSQTIYTTTLNSTLHKSRIVP